MKVKEIDKVANLAWSPSAHHPIYLAAGTAAQQLDATFSTTATLEIFDLNLGEPGLDMCLKGSIVCDYRFHKIIWGCNDKLVGGADGGNILVYDPEKILIGEESLLYKKTSHSGPVNSLDFNKFQDCLLASGSCGSEIFIWDLNNLSSPVILDTNLLRTEDVTAVAWNAQVQHILASTFPTRCVVWDVRKSEPIIKVSDSSRMKCKAVAWHPEVATQLCLASDDDHNPLIQLWDLRYASTPVRNLEKHQKGILAIAWCIQDPDLLLSCSKDNHVFCWNPNSSIEDGEIIGELPTDQWCFDVAWCPRNPAVVASSSCDGHVSVYSLMGGQSQTHTHCRENLRISESFPGSEMLIQQQISDSNQERQSSAFLKYPPKWLRKPVGASFSFGGKIITFSNIISRGGSNIQQHDKKNNNKVFISQVVTEPEVVNKALELEAALSSGKLAEFCHAKAENSNSKGEKMEWSFLEATFASSPREKMLPLLGYNYQTTTSLIARETKRNSGVESDLTEKMAEMLPRSTSPQSATSAIEDFDSLAQKKEDLELEDSSFLIETEGYDDDSALTKALLIGNIELAVNLCLSTGKWADALVLAQVGGHELLQNTKKIYFKSCATNSSKLISAVVGTCNWRSVIRNCDISCWKEGLAAIITYANPEEFAHLCDLLGNRLENEKYGVLMQNASLCYISSGNVERFTQLWNKIHKNKNDAVSLENLVEQVMVLRQAVEHQSGNHSVQSTTVSAVLEKFAGLLASQGHLKNALIYLGDSNKESAVFLKNRIYQSLSLPTPFLQEKALSSGIQLQQGQSSAFSSEASQASSAREPLQYSFSSSQQQSQSQFQSYVPNVLRPASSVPVPYSNFNNNPQYQMTTPLPAHVLPQPPVTSVPLPSHMTANVAPPPPADTPNCYGKKSSIACSSVQRYPNHFNDNPQYQMTTPLPAHVLPQPPVATVPAHMTANVAPPPSADKPNSSGSIACSSFQRYPKHDASADYKFLSQQQYFPMQSYSGFALPEVSNNQQNVPQQSTSYCYAQSNTSTINTRPPVPSMQSHAPPGGAMPSDHLPPTTSPIQLTSSSSSDAFLVEGGWNDPPMLKRTTSLVPQLYRHPYAITAPLPNVGPTARPSMSTPVFPHPDYSPPQAAELQPVEVSHTNELGSSGLNPATLPRPSEEKASTSDYRIIEDVFEDLRKACHISISNPLALRKLNEVAKGLEGLYVKLRDRSLSKTVEEGLHQIANSINQGDYCAAMAAQGVLISSANFSEICSFMPSVKVLLQTAIQYNVRLN